MAGFAFNPIIEVLKWPASLKPDSLTIHQQSNTTRFISPFTRTTQTQELPGGIFNLSASFPPMVTLDQRTARAFLARLRGSSGRFYFRAEIGSGPIPDAGVSEPLTFGAITADTTRFTADSTHLTTDATVVVAQVVVTATGVGDDSTTIHGTTAETPGRVVVEAGRHISFDSADGWRHLHLVVQDAVALHGGALMVIVEPPMRSLPAAGANLHLVTPSGIFMLTDDDQGQIVQSPGGVGQFSIEAVQAFPPRITVTP